MRRTNRIAMAATIAFVAVLCACASAFVWLPEWITNGLHIARPSDYLVFLAATRTSTATFCSALLTSISAFSALGTLYAAYRSYLSAQDKQAADVLAKSTELLGSGSVTSRLGGVYALRRLASVSRSDDRAVVAILSGFVRTRSCELSRDTGSTVDLQAALTALGERPAALQGRQTCIDLSNTSLSNVDLRGDWTGAILRDARLTSVDLSGCLLSNAQMHNATLVDCTFTGATIEGANLYSVFIQRPHGLTQEQLDLSAGDATTVIPDSFSRPSTWLS